MPLNPQYASGFGFDWPTSSELERAVKMNQRTAYQWTQTRKCGPVKLTGGKTSSPLMGLKVLQDRWLVCVYNNASIQVWDLDNRKAHPTSVGHPPPTLFLETTSSGHLWMGFSAAIDGEHIIVALTRASE